MRKRGIAFMLAAAMIIGSAGLSGGSSVRADEDSTVIETGATETDATIVEEEAETDVEDAAAEIEVAEAGEENWEKFQPPAVWPEPDEAALTESVDNAEEDFVYDNDAEDMALASDALPENWIKDYDYKISGSNVVLKKYKGSDTKVVVGKTATIKGKTYNVKLSATAEAFDSSSIWSGTNVERISFVKGFVFPENSAALFAYCQKLKYINLSGVDTSKVKNMSWMFFYCDNLQTLDVSSFNTSNVTNMQAMFGFVESVKSIDCSNFDTRKVTNIERMFSDCYALQKVDVSSFNTGNVTLADAMFSECKALKSVDLSNFDLSKVKEESNFGIMEIFFYNCQNLQKVYTPKNLKYTVKLAHTMFDPKGHRFDSLPTNTSNTKRLVTDFTGWSKTSDKYVYIKKGSEYKGKTTILGKGYIGGKLGWYVATSGVYDKKFVGIAKMHGGEWVFARNGKMDTSFTGVAQATNGIWYYVNKGKIDRNFSGKLVKATNGRYYYVSKGKPTKKFTGKIAQTTDGAWYYCTNGRPDLTFSGKICYCTNGNWYYVTKGKINNSFTGIATATNGKKYYVQKGVLNKNFTGTVKYNGKMYNIVNGAVK